MIKIILTLSFLWNSILFANEFQGCGEYLFKGILKGDKGSPLLMTYLVHAGTISEMKFLLEKKDLITLSPYANTPSSFKAKILKKMDQTLGTLVEPTEIASRFPNPLNNNDTGIRKLKDLDCK